MYTKILGAAIIVACTTLFAADVVKQRNDMVRCINSAAVYFGRLAETLASEVADLASAMEQSMSAADDDMKAVISGLCECIRSSSSSSLSNAWQQCKGKLKGHGLSQTAAGFAEMFVNAAGNSIQGCIKAAKDTSECAKAQYEKVTKKSKKDNKLILNAGICAGVLVVVLLI